MIKQARALQQAADDLDPLALADREGVDLALGVERQAVGVADLAHPRGQGLHVGDAVDAQRHVLQDGHGLEQREVLEDHADTQRPGGLGIGHAHWLAVPEHLTLVGVQHAVDDLDQGTLAGAVLAQERVDLARGHGRSRRRSWRPRPGTAW